jgi:hypothetical protein
MRASRLKLKTQQVNLGDDTGLRWVSLLPEGSINAHGTTWRFDAAETDADKLQFRFDDAVESLERWLSDYAPAIAVEHNKDGTAAGYLRRIVVLTKAEALTHGIKQPSSRMIYGGLDITSPKWAAAFDAGEVPYVSPNIRAWAGTELDDSPSYPFAIGEVSFVTIPQIKNQQVPVADMRGVSLSEGANMAMTKDDCAAYCAEAGLDEAAAAALIAKLFPELHTEAHAANPDLNEEAEAIEAAAIAELEKAKGIEEAVEEVKEEDEESLMGQSYKDDEALLSEVIKLKRELAVAKRTAALAHVRSALGNRKVSSATESMLADAFVAGKGKFEAMLADFAPGTSVKTAAPAPRTIAPVGVGSREANLGEALKPGSKHFANLSDDDQWALITQLATKESITVGLAASWLSMGRTPDAVLEMKSTRGSN